jgi:hypothetical protein
VSGVDGFEISIGLVDMAEVAAEYLDDHPPKGYWVRHSLDPSALRPGESGTIPCRSDCRGCAWSRGEIANVDYFDLPQWVRYVAK